MIHQTQIILVSHKYDFPKHSEYIENKNVAKTVMVFVKNLKC